MDETQLGPQEQRFDARDAETSRIRERLRSGIEADHKAFEVIRDRLSDIAMGARSKNQS